MHANVTTACAMLRRRALSLFNLVLASVLANVLAAAMLAAPAHAASRTIVSLTFDDGLTQSPVRDILRNRGVKGTFYVNANLIGTGGGYLTKAELDALFADGNEIAGHTTNHVDLATLSDAAQRTAICGDLQTLNSWYPNQIRSLAYPFASTGPNTQSIVASGCTGVGAYTNARTVGGLVSGAQCSGCATAESIPPGNPYFINTPESILSTTTLDQIKTLVTQAENNGGGWVPLVFHQVCSGSGCSSYSVTPATLDAFVVWLKARESNSTYVRTVQQVISGDLPPAPPPAPLGPNLLSNPSLELDQNADGVADCWQRNGYGTNTVNWTRTNDAHSGSFAERLQITAYSSGDRKLIPTMDAGQAAGGCAPNVVAGASYELGAWYKSTTAVTPVLFHANASGTWVYWRDGPLLPATATWAQMTFLSGAVPAGAQAISFGIALDAVGTLTTDDYSAKRVLDGPADGTPPSIAITSPGTGAVVGTVTVLASATDNVGVTGVQFLLDGANLGLEDTAAPFSIAWNTTTATNGTHTLTARARDAAGNTTTSAAVSVTVNNVVTDTTPPTVSISAPATGTVTGSVTISATAADNIGVLGVQFKLDGVNLGTEDTTAPYSISWNSVGTTNGAHSLTAVARDAAGNTTTSAVRSVTVSNAVADTTPPTVSISAPATGTVTGSAVTVSATAADNVGVVGVQFKLDGVNLGTEDTTAPYSIVWNSVGATNGTHPLTAVARDAAGNSTTSAALSVTVSNTLPDTTPPTVSISAPAAGTVAGTLTVSATAVDAVGVVGVQFRLDGANLGVEDTTSPYSVSWITTTTSNGAHTLTAVARDAAGNSTTSTAVVVTVNNVVAPSAIQNASLETDANSDGVPDCWLLGGYGTNTATWSRVAGRTGSFAESLQVTARSSGDRKLVQMQDAGTCAPAATPGTRYTISAWYKSTVATGFVAYYRTSAGAWVYWTSGPTVASAANWTQATFTTPALPAGATHISFGLYLAAVGTLVTDDYAMTPAP